MKSILHIITGLDDGGAEAVLYRLCTHDQSNLHHVISLSGQGKYGPLLRDARVPVTCLQMPRGRVTLAGLRQMWRTIRLIRPDVVQTWMYHANLLGGMIARTAGQRNICWGIHHSVLAPGTTARKTILVSQACARLSRSIPRRIICCAEQARLAHVKLGYDPERMAVVPNGYDLSTFQPDPAAGRALRAEWGLGASESIIGFVSRFHPLKDHANLFHALALMRQSGSRPMCVLVGTGMDQQNAELNEMIGRFGLADQIRLLGQRNDIPAVMNALDLHVMSSAGEAFPNVLAEAMACGTPCVSTDVGDAREIVGDTGRIVPPGDPASLGDAIADLLAERSRPEWLTRQEAARRHISQHFSVGRMVESYQKVWFGTQSQPHT